MAPPPDTPGRGEGGGARARTHRLLLATVAIGWLVADQLSKSWAESALRDGPIDLFWSLRFNLAYNTGASFGIGGGYGSWISLVALVVVGVLLWQGRSVQTRLGAVALGMIVGGAVGNVIDRAFRGDDGFMSGAVVDFIDLQWWPIFNIADIGVVGGGLLLVASVLFGDVGDEDGGGAADPGGVGATAGPAGDAGPPGDP